MVVVITRYASIANCARLVCKNSGALVTFFVRILFGVLCLFSGPSLADVTATLEAAAREPLWLRLLHEHQDSFGRWRSKVVRDNFFFAPLGSSPLEELRATHAAFSAGQMHNNGLIKQAAVCAFPARRTFLEKKLGVRYPEPESCSVFETWRDGLAAQDVSLVFSTYFVTNPASMFGHVFLRLDQTSGPMDPVASDAAALLSYAVSFAAHVTTDNPVLYGYWGLTGGFTGYYYIDPFYMKAKEYGFGENRDLFAYRLQFSKEETERLVAHLWELYGQAAFTYYFFDANCATYMLELLEVAKPEWELAARHTFYDLPSEALKRVVKAAGQPEVTQHFSLRHELLEKLHALSVAERAQLIALARSGAVPDVSIVLSAPVLDTWIYLEQMRAYRENPAKPERLVLLDRLRQRRLRLAAATTVREEIRGEDLSVPHLGHQPFRLGLFAESYREEFPGFGFTVRPGFHEFGDAVPGYPLTQSVAYLKAEIYQGVKQKAPYLRRFTVLDIMATPPFMRLDPQPSWFFSANFRQGDGAVRSDEPVGELAGGIGLSVPLGASSWQLLSFVLTRAQFGRWVEEGAKQHWLPGVRAALRGTLWDRTTLAFDQEFTWLYEPDTPGVPCNVSRVSLASGPGTHWRLSGAVSYQTCGLQQERNRRDKPTTGTIGMATELAWYL